MQDHKTNNYTGELTIMGSKGNMAMDPEFDSNNKNRNPTKGRLGFLMLFNSFAENTCTSGVPNCKRADHIVRKLIWLAIVLAGIGCTIWQIALIIMKYYQYEVKAANVLKQSTHLTFPAVTFCNLVPVLLSKVAAMPDPTLFILLQKYEVESDNFFSNDNTTTPSPTPSPNSGRKKRQAEDSPSYYDYYDDSSDSSGNSSGGERGSSVYDGSINLLYSEALGGTLDEDMIQEDIVRTFLDTMSTEEKMALSTDLSTFLFSCTFNKYTCSASDFTQFYNPTYGNCYTFNVNTRNETRITLQKGPYHGLIVELFINQTDYPSVLTEEAGARMSVTPQYEYPIPEDKGFFVLPGALTSVGLRKKTAKRMSSPYGKCKTYSASEMESKDANYKAFNETEYSQASSLQTCLQQFTMKRCGCYLPNIPHTGMAFSTLIVKKKIIDTTKMLVCNTAKNSKDYRCSQIVLAQFVQDKLGCYEECPLRCQTESFDFSISHASWPAISKQNDTNKVLLRKGLIENLDQGARFSENNLVKVEVFYTNLIVEEMTESADYDLNQFLNEFGGQVGLWLGFSVVGLCEIFELVIDLFILGGRSMWPKS